MRMLTELETHHLKRREHGKILWKLIHGAVMLKSTSLLGCEIMCFGEGLPITLSSMNAIIAPDDYAVMLVAF